MNDFNSNNFVPRSTGAHFGYCEFPFRPVEEPTVVHNNNPEIITQEDKRNQYLPRQTRLFKVDDCPGFNQVPQDLYSLIENSTISSHLKFDIKAVLASNHSIKSDFK